MTEKKPKDPPKRPRIPATVLKDSSPKKHGKAVLPHLDTR